MGEEDRREGVWGEKVGGTGRKDGAQGRKDRGRIGWTCEVGGTGYRRGRQGGEDDGPGPPRFRPCSCAWYPTIELRPSSQSSTDIGMPRLPSTPRSAALAQLLPALVAPGPNIQWSLRVGLGPVKGSAWGTANPSLLTCSSISPLPPWGTLWGKQLLEPRT